jgi:hypothetical protein
MLFFINGQSSVSGPRAVEVGIKTAPGIRR